MPATPVDLSGCKILITGPTGQVALPVGRLGDLADGHDRHFRDLALDLGGEAGLVAGRGDDLLSHAVNHSSMPGEK